MIDLRRYCYKALNNKITLNCVTHKNDNHKAYLTSIIAWQVPGVGKMSQITRCGLVPERERSR